MSGLSGSTLPLFFSNTSDLRTASRATARWAGAASRPKSPACLRDDGRPASKMPSRIFTRRMRATASSRRCIVIVPSRTCASVFSYSPCQLFGAMNRSRPALNACGQETLLQPATWPWPFQSPTTSPSKPMRPTSTPSSISR